MTNKTYFEGKAYTEEDLIMISALSHYSYCPRRCALIHIEEMWEENRFTAEGSTMCFVRGSAP
jgi:CRISPR-associated exonuclease Cas4